MTFLLDTNVVSEMRRPKPHGGVRAWYAGTRDDLIFIPAIVFREIQAGIERSRRHDPAKAAEIEDWLDDVFAASNVVAIDGPIFRRHARLMQGQQDELWEDALIAATALEHGMTVVTRNERDFDGFGVALLNPFTFAA